MERNVLRRRFRPETSYYNFRMSNRDPRADPDPKLSAPDPDPERGQPGVSLLPVREPVEPGPDVVDPGLEPSPA
jgi:hypothetical protein